LFSVKPHGSLGFKLDDILGFKGIIDCIYVLGIMLNENGD
jgi:hypothetical protein